MKQMTRTDIWNLVVVTIVSLLIWFWAAGQTSETETVYASVAFETPEQVVVTPRAVPGVEIRMRGPLQAVRKMTEYFRDPLRILVGSPGVPDANGEHLVDVAALARNAIEELGEPVQVISAEPTSIQINVTRMVERTVKIEPRLPEGARTTGRVEVVPSEGTLIIPEEFADTELVLKLLADIPSAELSKLEPGRRYVIPATIELPIELQSIAQQLKFSPPKAEVSVALVSAETDHVLPAVPIQVAAPPADLDRYNVKIAAGNEFLRDVTLRGLPQDIRRIIDGEVRVAAFVHLTSDDLVQNVKERPISMWMLPDGVSVIRIGNGDTISPRIPLEITDRPAG